MFENEMEKHKQNFLSFSQNVCLFTFKLDDWKKKNFVSSVWNLKMFSNIAYEEETNCLN